MFNLLKEAVQLEAYNPAYKEDQKFMVGSAKDWLKDNEIAPEEVQKAMARVKGSPLFRNDVPAAGLEYGSSASQEKNGTFVFKSPSTFRFVGRDKITIPGTIYQVYANGQIRGSYPAGAERKMEQSKLSSPKPKVIPGDRVGTMVATYTASIEEVIKKWKKASKKQEKELADLMKPKS